MAPIADQPNSKPKVKNLSEVKELYRTHVEALHNLRFLLGPKVELDTAAADLVAQMESHLNCLTDILCRD
jgi:hypothetical protein